MVRTKTQPTVSKHELQNVRLAPPALDSSPSLINQCHLHEWWKLQLRGWGVGGGDVRWGGEERGGGYRKVINPSGQQPRLGGQSVAASVFTPSLQPSASVLLLLKLISSYLTNQNSRPQK